MAYNGSVDLISGIRPKNNGSFPLVDAKDVFVTDGKRLDAALDEKMPAADALPKPEAEGTEGQFLKNAAEGATAWGDVTAEEVKVTAEKNLDEVLGEKADAVDVIQKPAVAGTEGQHLEIDANGDPVWLNPGTPTDTQVGDAVDAWLTAHPEATTTVQDGTITRAKLDADLQQKTDEVSELKSAINEVDNKYKSIIKVGPVNTAGVISSSGSMNNLSGHLRSGYIPITAKRIAYNIDGANAVGLIAFYSDTNLAGFISALTVESRNVVTGIIDVPETAKYYAACFFYPDTPGQYVAEITNYSEIINAYGEIAAIDSDIANKLMYKGVNCAFDVPSKYLKLDGSEGTYNDSAVTKYIPVNGASGITYKLKKASVFATIAFYTYKKELIPDASIIGDGALDDGSAIATASIPSNAYYFRATKWNVSDSFWLRLDYCVDYFANAVSDVNNKHYLYGDSIEKPFSFNGKTIMSFGDSITAGVANEGSGNYNAGENSYIRKFCTHVGATLTNKAVSGSTITFADGETINSIYSVITGTTDPADIIIIAGGVNDYVTGKALGTWGDNTEYTFYGALKKICDYLSINYSGTPVIFITPVNITKEFNNTPTDHLNLYRNAIFEVATYYGYNVVDGRDMIPVSKNTGYDITMIASEDGCHPTLKGHAIYARDLCMKLC